MNNWRYLKNRATWQPAKNVVDEQALERIVNNIERLSGHKAELEESIPAQWQQAREGYNDLNKAVKKTRITYRNNVDQAYQAIAEIRG